MDMLASKKEIVNKILKSWNIAHRDLWASKQEVEEIREYLPTVWYKLLTSYFYSITTKTRTKQAKNSLYNYSNWIDTTKYSSTKFREKAKWRWRIYSIIKL